ncbi:glycosyltransferase family 4 protein [Stigmatella aurantiaca]|uniref:Glycosyl transferase group 1 n=1 Tax=Stigmatella aurantiaca (strain DW4/3-1) TaxID=378806 RepID=Q08X73_STIAD|nr:glycosyltransferase family 4 protein [Stigmatella aurantiaca]ADO71094.1 Glycosyl transferase group 1 [Stigmatella aurantiaca DW4/3-1]EAU65079.1 phosphatidylinositol glycan-class A [Stigmatella aurantiaca DW4/3-1]
MSQNALRICFISRRFFPAISGMSVYALNLVKELVACGHDVTMVSQYRNDAAGASVYGGGPPPGIPGARVLGRESQGEQRINAGLPASFEQDVEDMVATVEREHRERPFDLIHAQYGYPCGLAALEASRRLGLPNVVSIQGGDGHWVGTCCGTHKQAMLAVLGHSGALLIGSRTFAEEVQGHHGTPLERFTFVPGATDTRRFHPRKDSAPGALKDPPVLLYHGRVDARKGVMELLDAVKQLVLRDRRRLKLLVSGIGPDVNAVKARVADEGLQDSVELTGYSAYEDAPELYRRGDLFVSPTYAEGFSNTILEAMATGLPIVSTRAVGVLDCLEDGRNGLLVPPRDANALAEAIARVLDDAALRRRLARTALEEARALYSWQAVGRQIQQVYADLLGTRPDTRWTNVYDPATTEATADLSCRFRSSPHLL